MASTWLNIIIDKYWSNILEINPEQTKLSLLNGTINWSQVKFKDELFKELNLPYITMKSGYIGSISFEVSLPRFYLYPIKVFINDIHFHAEIQDWNTWNSEYETKILEDFKQKILKNKEEFLRELSAIKSEAPGYLELILNNLELTINSVSVTFEDNCSLWNKKSTYGIDIKLLNIISDNHYTDANWYPDDPNYIDIKYKAIDIVGLSIYIDKQGIPEGNHSYLIKDFNLKMWYGKNEKYNQQSNKLPLHSVDVAVNKIDFHIHLNQIKRILKTVSYIQMKKLYISALMKDIYINEMSEEEKEIYLEWYYEYYKCQYIEAFKDEGMAWNYKTQLNELEKKYQLEEILKIKESGSYKIEIWKRIGEIDNEITLTESSWIIWESTREATLKKWNDERTCLWNKLENKGKILKKLKKSVSFNDNHLGEHPVTSEKLRATLNISFIGIKWIKKKPIASLGVYLISTKIIWFENSTKSVEFGLKNISLEQGYSLNRNYRKIISTSSSNTGDSKDSETNNLIDWYLDINNLLSVKVQNKINIVVVIQPLLRINNEILKVIKQSLDLNNIIVLVQGQIRQYISKEFTWLQSNDIFKPNNNQMKYDIQINSPSILIPLSPEDTAQANYLYLNLGNLTVTTAINEVINGFSYDKYTIQVTGVKSGIIYNWGDTNALSTDSNEILIKDVNNTSYVHVLRDSRGWDNALKYMITNSTETIEISVNETQIELLCNVMSKYIKEIKHIQMEKSNSKTQGYNGDTETWGQIKEDGNENPVQVKCRVDPSFARAKAYGKAVSMNKVNWISIDFNIKKLKCLILKSLSSEEEEIVNSVNTISGLEPISKYKPYLNWNLNGIHLDIKVSTVSTVLKWGWHGVCLSDDDYTISVDKKNNTALNVPYLDEKYKNIINTKRSTESIDLKSENAIDKIKEDDVLSLEVSVNKVNKTTDIALTLSGIEVISQLSTVSRLHWFVIKWTGFINGISQEVTETQRTKEERFEITNKSSVQTKANNNVNANLKWEKCLLVLAWDPLSAESICLFVSNDINATYNSSEDSSMKRSTWGINWTNGLIYLMKINKSAVSCTEYLANTLQNKRDPTKQYDIHYPIAEDYSIGLKYITFSKKATHTIVNKILFEINPNNISISLHLISLAQRYFKNDLSPFLTQLNARTNKTNITGNQPNNMKHTDITTYSDIKIEIVNTAIILCDYPNDFFYSPFLQCSLPRIVMNYIKHDEPTDSSNFGLSLIEMITNMQYPIESFEIKSLYKYINISIDFNIKYYNSKNLYWESFVESCSLVCKAIQVLPVTNLRLEIVSKKALNINISSNWINILSQLKHRYSQITDNPGNIVRDDGSNYFRISNQTGVDIKFWFKQEDNIWLENNNNMLYNKNEYMRLQKHSHGVIHFCISGGESNTGTIPWEFNYLTNASSVHYYRVNDIDIELSSYVNPNDSRRVVQVSSIYKIINYTNIDDIVIKYKSICIPVPSGKCRSFPINIVKTNKDEDTLFIKTSDGNYVNTGILFSDAFIDKKTFVSYNETTSIEVNLTILNYTNNIENSSYRIEISAPMKIINNTPFTFTLAGVDIQPLKKENVYAKETNDLINLIHNKLHFSLSKSLKNNSSYTVTTYNSINNTLHFNADDAGDGTQCSIKNMKNNTFSIHFDYLFFNKTEHDINISNWFTIKSNSVFPYSWIQGPVTFQAGEYKSDISIEINVLNNSMMIYWGHKNNFIKFTLTITTSPTYPNTIIITIVNRYRYVNTLPFDIKLNNNQVISTLPQGKEVIPVFNAIDNTSIKVCWDESIGEYSNNFDIEALQEFDIKVKVTNHEQFKECTKFTYDEKEFHLLIHCSVCLSKQETIFITFSLPQYPMHLIENLTKFPIEITPICQNKTTSIIPPNKAIPYLSDTNISKCDLRVGDILREVPWNNYKMIEIKTENALTSYYVNIGRINNNYTTSICITETKPSKQVKRGNKLISLLNKYTPIKAHIYWSCIGISWINDEPKEYFYLSCYGIDLIYSKYDKEKGTETFEKLVTYVKNIQIDNSLKNSIYKIIIRPEYQIIPQTEARWCNNDFKKLVPFIQWLAYRHSYINKSVTIIPQFEIIVQPVVVNIDNETVFNAWNLWNNYYYNYTFISKEEDWYYLFKNKETSLQCGEGPDFIETALIPLSGWDPVTTSVNSRSIIQINYFIISGLKIILSVKNENMDYSLVYIPPLIDTILQYISNCITRVQETPFRYNEWIIESISNADKQLISKLISFYKISTLSQVYKLLFNLDIIGNPVKIIDNIGSGFVELLNEPRKNWMSGGTNFDKCIQKEITRFKSKIISASMDSIINISESLLSNTNKTQTKKEGDWEESPEEVEGIIDGITKGITKGVSVFVNGIVDSISEPYQKYNLEGSVGMIKGVGGSLVNLALSPINAGLQVINYTAKGINSSTFVEKEKVYKFREARYWVPNQEIKDFEK